MLSLRNTSKLLNLPRVPAGRQGNIPKSETTKAKTSWLSQPVACRTRHIPKSNAAHKHAVKVFSVMSVFSSKVLNYDGNDDQDEL